MNVTDSTALTAVACVGINAARDPGALTITADLIQGPAEVQKVHIAMSNTLPYEGITFIETVDSDGDGLLSDEASQTNNMIVTYMDNDKMVRDITWTTTELGYGDGDLSLEAAEMFLLTIDLRAVDPVPTARAQMTFHIAPYEDSSIPLIKRVPSKVSKSMILR